MQELSLKQVELVSGGEMSGTTKIIIGGALIASPIVGAGMVLGYYANKK